MAYPTSVKGVVIHQGRVLLLLNGRREWELPGGRPEPGERHRTALEREVREETGLRVAVGEALGEHLFEVLPGRIVRIIAFGCRLSGSDSGDAAVSDEHLEACWLPVERVADMVGGHWLPACYRAAICQAIAHRPSSSERFV
jgi:8-oxo-dGTP pyrophosphatase MutT (NUDIX family)